MYNNIKNIGVLLLILIFGCDERLPETNYTNFSEIESRYSNLYDLVIQQKRLPKTEDINLQMVSSNDWTSGFFSGCLYYLYLLSENQEWKSRYQGTLEIILGEQFHTMSHDVGFIISCSFARSMEFGPEVNQNAGAIHNAANSLGSRYNSKTKCIISWDHPHFENPVIIDNLMNLDIIYKSLALQKDPNLEGIAYEHLQTTLEFFKRADSTWYHIVEFNENDGTFKRYRSGQAESINSAWTRGQTWGIYGMLMAYKHFKQPEYLKFSIQTCEVLIKYFNEDFTLNWDLRSSLKSIDISSSTILASALVDLHSITGDQKYLDLSISIVNSLSNNWIFKGTEYFIFGYSVGNLPKGREVSKSLIYADYYYLETLVKLKKLNIEIL